MPKPYFIIDKLAVCASIKHGESEANESCDNGEPKLTICGWLRDNVAWFFRYMVDSTDLMKRKKARNVKGPQFDDAVFTCFVKERQVDTLHSSPVLSIQAQKLHNNLHADKPWDTVASKGWLHHFQYCHGITEVQINSEARSAHIHATNESVPVVKKYVADNDFVVDQTYKDNETALYFKILQNKILSVKSDIHEHNSFKQSIDHVNTPLVH